MAEEEAKNLEFLWSERNPLSCAAQFHPREVYFYIVETENLYLVGCLIEPPHPSAHPCQKLTRTEWLGYIIVGPELQQQYLVQDIAGRAQNQNWHIGPFMLDFAAKVLTD
jgi:hypothetical protein